MAQVLGEAHERMLSVAVAALNEREPERLWPLLATALPGLCGGDTLVYKLDDWNETEGTVGMPPGVAAEPRRARRGGPEPAARGVSVRAPLRGRVRPCSLTARRAAGRVWSASPTARLIGDVIDADHVLALPLPRSTTPITGCMIYRSGADFTDDHVRAAQQLQPLLAAVEEQRQLLIRWQRLAAASPDGGSAHALAAECALTPRELTVLLLLTDALTAAAIGRRLGISDRTVHKHVEKIYRKLGTRDRISTVLRAQQLGLVPTP